MSVATVTTPGRTTVPRTRPVRSRRRRALTALIALVVGGLCLAWLLAHSAATHRQFAHRWDTRRAEVRASYTAAEFTVQASTVGADGSITVLGHYAGHPTGSLHLDDGCTGQQVYRPGGHVALWVGHRFGAPTTAVRTDRCEQLADGGLPDGASLDWSPIDGPLPVIGLLIVLVALSLAMTCLLPDRPKAR